LLTEAASFVLGFGWEKKNTHTGFRLMSVNRLDWDRRKCFWKLADKRWEFVCLD